MGVIHYKVKQWKFIFVVLHGIITMNNLFIAQMHKEERANSKKGHWDSWFPHPHTWMWEMQHHIAKLQNAIQRQDKEHIKEHAADLGLYAEKAFVKYGLSQKDRISKFRLAKALKKPTIYMLATNKLIKIS